MRKLLISLLSLGALVGAGSLGGAAQAAPAPAVSLAGSTPAIERVQYYAPGWREHDEWRRREAWRRGREWRGRRGPREFRGYARPPLPYYGYGPAPYYGRRY